MARRNHSRRAHAPYGSGHPGIGYAEEEAGRAESQAGGREAGWGDEGREEMGRWGGMTRMVSERPNTSLMTAFGVGFGLGLLVTLLLNREEEGWFERYAPESIQDLPERFQHARHSLSDTMAGSLKHAGGSLRHAGESLASYVPSSWKRR